MNIRVSRGVCGGGGARARSVRNAEPPEKVKCSRVETGREREKNVCGKKVMKKKTKQNIKMYTCTQCMQIDR